MALGGSPGGAGVRRRVLASIALMKKKLGEVLLEQGLITREQLSDALTLQRRNGMRLGAALVARGHLTESKLVAALGTLLELTVVELSRTDPDPAAVRLVSRSFASDHDLFPFALRRERGRTVLTVAMSDPLNYTVIDELGFITNAQIEAVLARSSDIDQAIRRNYGFRTAHGSLEGVRYGLAEDDGGEMTILRPGGAEEKVNTETHPAARDLAGGPAQPVAAPSGGEATSNPHPPRVAPAPPSPILLTEPKRSQGAPARVARPPAPERPPAPVTRGPAPGAQESGPQPAAPRGAPLSEGRSPPVAPLSFGGDAKPPQFDETLGALIDAAGHAVNADSFRRLERKFWALMRVLAKKGILTNEDFLRELEEEQGG